MVDTAEQSEANDWWLEKTIDERKELILELYKNKELWK